MPRDIDDFTRTLERQLLDIERRIRSFHAEIDDAQRQDPSRLQERSKDARASFETRRKANEARRKQLDRAIADKRKEVAAQIEEWKNNRQIKRLTRRAERAEEVATWSLLVAAAALEDVDYAVIDAIAARRDADEAIEAAERDLVAS